MRKSLLRKDRTKCLYMIYDAKQCFYVVSIGEIKITRNGDITSKNVLHSSEYVGDCLNYFGNGGKK